MKKKMAAQLTANEIPTVSVVVLGLSSHVNPYHLSIHEHKNLNKQYTSIRILINNTGALKNLLWFCINLTFVTSTSQVEGKSNSNGEYCALWLCHINIPTIGLKTFATILTWLSSTLVMS